MESVTKSVIFADVSQNWLGPVLIHYIVIWYPKQMVQMAFCDLSHTHHKQVTKVSQHVFVILLWGILTSPLRENVKIPQIEGEKSPQIQLVTNLVLNLIVMISNWEVGDISYPYSG